VLDARRAELPRQRMRARLRIAIVGEELAENKIGEQRRDLVAVVGVRRELASELGAGVLPPREERDRALTQREGLLQVTPPQPRG
jgi:hypothetical protein